MTFPTGDRIQGSGSGVLVDQTRTFAWSLGRIFSKSSYIHFSTGDRTGVRSGSTSSYIKIRVVLKM
ncbi:hypothetical protein H6F50_00040 [Coleofasciculus sp. FACHB-712]|uniref:hypothetical protein n=1 Tax=Coleofasciculus sp. FACHB-712 TaxID=2692789 RepID=UPI001687DCB4|nr:hypothetical protein [Coleofasciculus sp. FACHB-712]MBD1940747.1 hypothetical protein [Coleofasciculus sp. FACHB-712]